MIYQSIIKIVSFD